MLAQINVPLSSCSPSLGLFFANEGPSFIHFYLRGFYILQNDLVDLPAMIRSSRYPISYAFRCIRISRKMPFFGSECTLYTILPISNCRWFRLKNFSYTRGTHSFRHHLQCSKIVERSVGSTAESRTTSPQLLYPAQHI